MMGNTTDILKELEDIGALGNKIHEPVIRRAAVVPLVVEFQPPPPLPSHPPHRAAGEGDAHQRGEPAPDPAAAGGSRRGGAQRGDTDGA